jgi:hypothetical protein
MTSAIYENGFNYTADHGGVNKFQLVYINPTNGKVAPFDATNPLLSEAVGMTTNSGRENDPIHVIQRGTIINSNWNLIPGQIYYASSGGNFSSTFPSRGVYQIIGEAVNATTLTLDIQTGCKIGV